MSARVVDAMNDDPESLTRLQAEAVIRQLRMAIADMRRTPPRGGQGGQVSRRPRVSEPVQVPTPPHVLWTDSGAMIHIEAVTEAGLREIGRLWTQALVRKARNKRKVTAALRRAAGKGAT